MTEKYLTTVPDSVTMDKQYFTALMRRFGRHHSAKYGFSRKHTADILEYRKSAGLAKGESAIPADLYNLPVIWNAEVTYVK